VEILVGHVLDRLAELPDESVHCVVTSPPYWGQRDYGATRQIGLERNPADYINALSAVFSEVRRTLSPSGCCWLNIADKWASGGNGGGGSLSRKRGAWRKLAGEKGWRAPPLGWKDKDLVLTSFMAAERLRQDGWFLRKTIIWSKPNAIEPRRLDRPSLSHEYVFLLSKRNDSAVRDPGEAWWHSSVWEITPEHYRDHPAVMPSELARRCILAGSTAGCTVLDPFLGSGTTALVADRLGRNCIGIELNPGYAEMARHRIKVDAPLFFRMPGVDAVTSMFCCHRDM
jgi:site-specific DNA-methyltransferase (cytosine-N4-specific)